MPSKSERKDIVLVARASEVLLGRPEFELLPRRSTVTEIDGFGILTLKVSKILVKTPHPFMAH